MSRRFDVEEMHGRLFRVTLRDEDGRMLTRRRDVSPERVEAVKRQLEEEVAT